MDGQSGLTATHIFYCGPDEPRPGSAVVPPLRQSWFTSPGVPGGGTSGGALSDGHAGAGWSSFSSVMRGPLDRGQPGHPARLACTVKNPLLYDNTITYISVVGSSPARLPFTDKESTRI